MKHSEKISLARRMMNRTERKTSNKIQIPALPHGAMISRLFTSEAWMRRKMARAGQFVVEPPIPEERGNEIKEKEPKESRPEEA